MKRYKFVGDGPVDVPALGLFAVEPGQVVDVGDPAIAAGLDGQSIWEPVNAPKKSKED